MAGDRLTARPIAFNGIVTEGGEIVMPQSFYNNVATLFAGRRIKVTVQRQGKKRSNNQNAYYFGVVVQMIADRFADLGDPRPTEEIHDFLKFQFNSAQVVSPTTGELIGKVGRSTADLKTFEFALYIDQCIQFAAEELGIEIPPPSTMREEYEFEELQRAQEAEKDYLIRVASYVEQIQHREQLEAYFRQVPEWKTMQKVRDIFNDRWKSLSN